MAIKDKSKSLLTTSHTFQRTPHVRDKEASIGAQKEPEKLEHWNRWLKNEIDCMGSNKNQAENIVFKPAVVETKSKTGTLRNSTSEQETLAMCWARVD
jgi:hypothetical protein